MQTSPPLDIQCRTARCLMYDAGLPVVDYFCGGKPFPSGPKAWKKELENLAVLVFEANTFLNLLVPNCAAGARANMQDIDLLVRLCSFELSFGQSLCDACGHAWVCWASYSSSHACIAFLITGMHAQIQL